MEKAISKEQVLSLLGSPAEIDRELQELRQSAQLFSSNRPRLVDEYAKKWVAVYRGTVKVSALTYSQLLQKLDEESIPRSSVLLRFIDKNVKTMVL